MRKLFSVKRLNLFIVLGLIVWNLYMWASVLQAAAVPYVVAPVRDPEIDALFERINAGTHHGETWQVTMTELEAEQTITWYLDRYPQIPFAHPRVKMTPNSLGVEGDATIAGLRIHGGGKVHVNLVDGLPVIQILEISVPLPDPIRQALEKEMQAQLRRAEGLPVRFTSAEWGDGVVVVRGVIR